MHSLLPEDISTPSPSSPNGPREVKFSLLESSLKFSASLVVDLVHGREFTDRGAWQRSIGVYMSAWVDKSQAEAFAESVRAHFHAIDQVRCTWLYHDIRS